MFCSTSCREEFYKHADFEAPIFEKIVVIFNKMKATFGELDNLMENMQISPQDACFLDLDFSDAEKALFKCFMSTKASSYRFATSTNSFTRYPFRQQINMFETLLENNAMNYRHFVPDNCGVVFIDGTFFSPFFVSMNSSCTPNIDYVCVENKLAFYVEKPIKAGDQLFIALA
jgi:hypothetical protein